MGATAARAVVSADFTPTAAAALISPAPYFFLSPLLVAVRCRVALIPAGPLVPDSQISAATPATCGEAIEVPCQNSKTSCLPKTVFCSTPLARSEGER